MPAGSPAVLLARGCFVAVAAVVALPPGTTRAAELVVSSYEDGNVYRVSAGGTKPVLASGLGQPHEVEVDRAGNVYVAEVDGDRLSKIAPDGTRTVLCTFPSAIDNPEGLALAGDGSLFATGAIRSPESTGPTKVVRLSPTGRRATFATAGTTENESAAFDPAGNLLVSDIDGTLSRITPGGTGRRSLPTWVSRPASPSPPTGGRYWFPRGFKTRSGRWRRTGPNPSSRRSTAPGRWHSTRRGACSFRPLPPSRGSTPTAPATSWRRAFPACAASPWCPSPLLGLRLCFAECCWSTAEIDWTSQRGAPTWPSHPSQSPKAITPSRPT